jgi:hypothetical protein
MKWEYRILHDLTAMDLGEIGEDGWDIVTVEFDDEGEILNAFAKRPLGSGGGQGGQGAGPGGGGQRRRRNRRGGGQGGQGGQGGGGGHRIGPMT